MEQYIMWNRCQIVVFLKAITRASATVRSVLVIAQGNFRLERLYVYSPWLCVCLSLWGLTPVLNQSTLVSFTTDTINGTTDSAKCRWYDI